MSDALTLLDALATPIAWCDDDGRVLGGNLAFARWLGVGQRRLPGLPLAAFEVEGNGWRE
jgi:two-component system, NtrC family, nitrogen regulation sensor histidine kinase GlnL